MRMLQILCLVLCLSGCFGKGKASQYFLMSAEEPLIRQAIEPTETVGIRPISMPEYLDREAIVTRKGNYQIRIDDLHRWAEPLSRNTLRVLRTYLEVKAPQYRFETFPLKRGTEVSKELTVSIVQFERVANGDVQLRAQSEVSGETFTHTVRAECEDGLGVELTVQCMTNAVEELASQISANLS